MIKCYKCGRFISYKDFEDGLTSTHYPYVGGLAVEPSDPEPVCKKCTIVIVRVDH